MRLLVYRRYGLAHPLYFLALALAIVFGVGPSWARDSSASKAAQVHLKDLPNEAQNTLKLVKADGPFPYKRDGATFGNFEGKLPKKVRGYYKEYTVTTPLTRDRGARRIVAGRNGEYYYTDDHYQTFRRIVE